MTDTTETSETTKVPLVSLLNQKGGVGKTTLTVQLAGALNAAGYDVLAVDLAPEGALTTILGFDEEYHESDQPVTMHELLVDPGEFAEQADDLVLEAHEFDLLPAHERMVDRTASALDGEPRARERLPMALESLRDSYDIVLIDNAPSINALTDNALANSDGVLIPTYAEALSVQAFDRLQRQIQGIEQYFGTVPILGIIINRIEPNNQAEAMVEQFEASFGELPIWRIRSRVALQRSLSQQQRSVFDVEESVDMADRLEEIAATVTEETNV